MRVKLSVAVAASLVSVHATAQQPQANLQLLAQAYDRCMATYAVRLTRTEATDEQIYSEATQSCRGLDEQLTAAINSQLPPAQAAEVLETMDAQDKPNFLQMLARIRSDRARNAGG